MSNTKKTQLAASWIGPYAHASHRRRLIRALRMSHLVLGFDRRNLALGSLGIGTFTAASALAVVWSSPASAQDSVCVDPETGTVLTSQQIAAAAAAGNQVLCGVNATATAPGAIAIGSSANVGGLDSLGAVTGENAVAIGANANASGDGAVVIGEGASAVPGDADVNNTAIHGIAIGSEASVSVNNALAIGYRATNSGQQATAIGWQASVSADRALAIGRYASVAGPQSTAIGHRAMTGTAYSALAIGDGATTAVGAGNNNAAIALGYSASAERLRATAIGSEARSQGMDSVAVGTNAAAYGQNDVFIGNGAGVNYAPKGVVTGTGANPYDIANYKVVNGQIVRADDTVPPASEIENFYVLNSQVRYLVDNTAVNPQQTATGTNIGIGRSAGVNSTGTDGVVVGNGASSGFYGTGAISLGLRANTFATLTRGFNSIAIGTDSKSGADDALALGRGATVGVGNNAQTTGSTTAFNTTADRSIAIGTSSGVYGASSIALGNAAVNYGTRSLALGTNAYISNGSNNIAIGAGAAAGRKRDGTEVGSGSVVAIGSNTRAYGNVSTAVGSGAVANQLGAAYGTNAAALGDTSFAFGGGSFANQYNAMAVGPNSRATGGWMATAVGESAVATRQSALAVGPGTFVSGVSSGAFGSPRSTEAFHSRDYNNGTAGIDNLSMVLANNAYAFGNNNLIGSSSTGSFALGNNVRIGAQSATVAQTTGTTDGVTTYSYTPTQVGAQAVTNAVGIGNAAQVWSTSGIALGSNAYAGDETNAAGSPNAIAIGADSEATGARAIAVGTGAEASGDQSISIGTGNVVTGNNSGAIGDPNIISGTGSYALGNDNTIDADYAFVLGNNVTVATGLDGSVVLGNNSAVAAAVDTASATIGGITYAYAGTTPVAAVSVGAVGLERTVTNVAAGRVSATSTDAINGSQLYATNQALGNLAASTATNLGGGTVVNPDGSLTAPTYVINGGSYTNVGAALAAATSHYYSVNDGGTTGGNYNNDGASGENSLAAGVDADASADEGVAIGYQALAAGGTTDGGATAIGYSASATGDGATALGSETVAVGSGATAVGDDANALALYSTAIGDGAEVTTLATGGVALGVEATTTVFGGVALGGFATADTTLGIAGYNPVTGGSSTSALPIWRSTAGAVSVGNVGVGITRQITDVAAGTALTDAVNVAQLRAAQTHYYSVNDGGTAGPNYYNTGATGLSAIAAGVGATGVGGQSSAFGALANAQGDRSTAIGVQSIALGSGSVAVGDSAYAEFASATAIGRDSSAIGADAVAVGHGADATGGQSAAFGPNAIVSAQSGLALGADTQVTASGAAGVALGASSSATVFGGVALGAASVADTAAGVSGYDPVTGAASTLTTPVWQSTLGAVSVGDVGSGFTRQITDVAAGTAATDAVNVAQLTAVANVANAGFNISAQGANTTNVAPGETVDFSNVDGNIVVAKDSTSDDVRIDLADDIELTSVTTGDSVLTTNGLTVDNGTDSAIYGATGMIIAGGPSVTTAGINAGNLTIVNVAPGTLSATSTDAVNGSQLYATNQQVDQNTTNIAANTTSIDNLGQSVANGLGGTSSYDPVTDSVTTQLAVGGNNYTNVNDALNAVNSVAGAGWNVAATGAGSTTANIGPNGTVTFAGDPNLTVTQTGVDDAGEVNFALNRDLDLDSVTTGNSVLDTNGLAVNDGTNSTTYGADGVSIAGGPSVTSGGVDAGGLAVTNVAAGTAATDAVNVAQLTAVANVANAGFNISAQGANTTNVAPGETVDFSNVDGNIVVAKDSTSDDVRIDLADDIELTSVTTGDSVLTTNGLTVDNGTDSAIYGATGMIIAGGPSVTTAGINAGNLTIVNVAPGTLSATSTDAVNGSQLYATNQQVDQNTTNIAANTTSIDNLGQSVASGLGGTSSYDPVTDSVTTQLAVGGNNYTNVNDALNAVNSVAGAGWNVAATGAGSTTANIGPNGTVTFAGDPNLTVTQTGVDDAGEVNFALNRDLDLDSVTTGNSVLTTNGLAVNDGTNSTTYGADGVSIAGGPSVTSGGIDAGSTTIANVAAGVNDTDAVNVAQLNNATAQIAINEAAISNVNDRVDAQGQSTANALGGTSSYDPTTGVVTTQLNVEGSTYTNVNDAINAISATANAGWNIAADGGPATNIASNGTLNVTSGSNVAVTLNGNSLNVAVIDNPTFGGMVTANGGLTVGANQTVNMGGNVVSNVGAGQIAANSTDAVNGSQLYAVQQVANNSVQYDDGDRTSVTFNPGGDATRLSNVAAGVADTDAVNVAQLNSGLLGAVNQANSYTDQRVNALAFDLGETRQGARAGTAGALAAAGLPQAFEAGKGMLAFGAGTYQGQSAFALGVSRILDDGKTIVKAGATYNTQSEAGANVGVGFQF